MQHTENKKQDLWITNPRNPNEKVNFGHLIDYVFQSGGLDETLSKVRNGISEGYTLGSDNHELSQFQEAFCTFNCLKFALEFMVETRQITKS